MRQSLGRLLLFPAARWAGCRAAAAVAAMGLAMAHSAPANCQASRTFTFAMDKTAIAPRVAGPIVVAAYAKLGYRVRLVDAPLVRSLDMANKNELDGELVRIAAISKTYPNLIRVTPSIYRVTLFYFSRHTDIATENRAGLSAYSIGIVRGVKMTADITDGLHPVVVDDFLSLFRMLDAGRLDLGVAPGDGGRLYAIMTAAEGVKAVGASLLTQELFHFVSRKNADIVPKVSRVLRQMSESGELDALRRRTLAEIYDEASKQVSASGADGASHGSPKMSRE